MLLKNNFIIFRQPDVFIVHIENDKKLIACHFSKNNYKEIWNRDVYFGNDSSLVFYGGILFKNLNKNIIVEQHYNGGYYEFIKINNDIRDNVDLNKYYILLNNKFKFE